MPRCCLAPTMKPPLGIEPADFYGNLADLVSDDTLMGVSAYVLDSVEEDDNSREDWKETYTKGLELVGYAVRGAHRAV